MIHLVPVATVLSAGLEGRPAPAIDISDDAATDYWAYRLNVSRDQLSAAIEAVGSSVAAVRRHLGR